MSLDVIYQCTSMKFYFYICYFGDFTSTSLNDENKVFTQKSSFILYRIQKNYCSKLKNSKLHMKCILRFFFQKHSLLRF